MLKKISNVLFLRPLYLGGRFFLLYSMVATLFVAAFFMPFLFPIGQVALILVSALVLVDAFLLFNPKVQLVVLRKLPKQLSLGDDNKVELSITNNYGQGLYMSIIDELPDEFQKRDFLLERYFKAGESHTFTYILRPVKRGEYQFHAINVFIQSSLGILERRIRKKENQAILVYPSIQQMKRFELMALSNLSTMRGVKKVRRLGHSYEFDQIRNYVKGDDYRSINWSATSRKNELMVNQYEDERSQQIFSVIDKGRAMQMPFNEMTLMDYAINTSLVVSRVALHKHDKAGVLSFSDKVGTTLKADSENRQLRLIIESLYKEQPSYAEANYELLYTATKQFIRRRSLLFLYTNFESYSAMLRVLPILRKINSMHLLVVVFFENSELVDYSNQEAKDIEEVYNKTIAAKFVQEKARIVQELRQLGIQVILTKPEDLSLQSINKYLELKARGLI